MRSELSHCCSGVWISDHFNFNWLFSNINQTETLWLTAELWWRWGWCVVANETTATSRCCPYVVSVSFVTVKGSGEKSLFYISDFFLKGLSEIYESFLTILFTVYDEICFSWTTWTSKQEVRTDLIKQEKKILIKVWSMLKPQSLCKKLPQHENQSWLC